MAKGLSQTSTGTYLDGVITIGDTPPPPVSGRVAHWIADNAAEAGGFVTGLQDETANANDLVPLGTPTFNAAALNGLATITFDGTDDALVRTLSRVGIPATAANRTMVAVVRFISKNYGGLGYGTAADNEQFTLSQYPTNQLSLQGGNGNAGNDFDSGVVSTDWMVFSVKLNNGVATIYQNQNEIGEFTHVFSTSGGGEIAIGKEVGNAFFKNLEFAEWEIYDNALSAGSLTTAIGDMITKYALSAATPDTTPLTFDLGEQVEANTGQSYSSNEITVQGVNAPTTVAVSGDGSPTWSKNNVNQGSGAGTAVYKDKLKLNNNASGSDATLVDAELLLDSSVNNNFPITTKAAQGENDFTMGPWDFESGNLGSKVSELGSAGQSKYDNTHVYGGTQSMIIGIKDAGSTSFGQWGGDRQLPGDVVDGQAVYYRVRVYMNSAFDMSDCVPNLGIKWLRFQTWDNAQNIGKGHVDIYIRENNKGFKYQSEPNTGVGDSFQTFGDNSLDKINLNRWETYIFHVVPSADPAKAYQALWKEYVGGGSVVDDKIVGGTMTKIWENIGNTNFSNSGRVINKMLLNSYWNRSGTTAPNFPPSPNNLWYDDIRVSTIKDPLLP